MRHDDNEEGRRLEAPLDRGPDGSSEESHVVFDFTGLEQANVGDLSLILTARLFTSPTEYVWVRSLPERTARILALLRLDHWFRPYPEMTEEMN